MGDTDMTSGVCFTLLTLLLTSPEAPFDGISIGDDLDVELVCGMSQSVETDMEEDISEFLICRVDNSILKLGFDRKNASKTLKHGLNPPFRIKIATDKPVTSVRISGKSTVSAECGAVGGSDVSITATDQSEISSFQISNAERTSIILDKKADAVLCVMSGSLMISTDNNAVLDIEQKSDSCLIDSKGTSYVVLRGETSSIDVTSNGKAKLILNGKSNEALFDCHNNSSTNASNLECTGNVLLRMSGACNMSVGVTPSLYIKTMDSGSFLEYYGNPAISIGEIKASSIKQVSQD